MRHKTQSNKTETRQLLALQQLTVHAQTLFILTCPRLKK